MKTLLIAINARHTHTSLAVRYLQNALDRNGISAAILETTINSPIERIMEDIAAHNAQRLLFSCYIWNREVIRAVGARCRALWPKAYIALGGPEVSYDGASQLAEMPWADAVFCGEGEELLPRLLAGGDCPRGVFSAAEDPAMDFTEFPYPDLAKLRKRVIYYEASRGCPFGCAYCLSAQRRVRYRPMELVERDLRIFINSGIMRVKFIDRTFNADSTRAMAIWRFLAENDNGYTSYQMEVSGSLFTQEQLEFLCAARPGLFQLEIGVQSTCEKALAAIGRQEDFSAVAASVRALLRAGRQHLHLDLIAGLPGEDLTRFGKSFDDVIALRPHKLQLGFLKVLRGSPLWNRRESLGLQHSPLPPYEILQTESLPFRHICALHSVEHVTDIYHNSGRFSRQLAYALLREQSAFEYFLSLARSMPPSPPDQYDAHDLLFVHSLSRGCNSDMLKWLMLLDICLHERPRRFPRHCAQCPPQLLKAARSLAAQSGVSKQSFVCAFPVRVLPLTIAEKAPAPFCVIAFDYEKRDLFGHAARDVIGYLENSVESNTKNRV